MANNLRLIGMRFIIGTLAGIAFAITGAVLGPTELVLTLLAIGVLLIVAARLVEKRGRLQAPDSDTLKEH